MIEVEDVEGVTVVRLAHSRVNALDIELCRAITETFKAIDSGGHRSVVLSGAGGAFPATALAIVTHAVGARRARRLVYSGAVPTAAHAEVVRLRQERVADRWIARYMARTVRR